MKAKEAKAPKKTSAPPPAPTLPGRDPRKAKKVRSVKLMIDETGGLERLIRKTSKKSPDRLQLLRRLAENYAEIEAAMLTFQTRAEVEARALRHKDKKRAARARAEAIKSRRTVVAARKSAIRYYTLIKNEHPSYSKLDEILYYLAYELEQGGDSAGARKVYYELIQKAASSPFVPRAYLAFGELFFTEAQGDPKKWELAAAAYKEVIKYPPPDNKVYGVARYKLAYVYWNRAELPQALGELKKVIQYAAQYPALPGAKAIGRGARRDIVTVYAETGAANKAWGFFQPLSGDPSGHQEKTVALLDELGTAYLDIGHYTDAITLYRELLVKDAGVRACHHQTQITVATQALKSGDKEGIVRELERQLRSRAAFLESAAPSSAKLECSNRTAELVTETAMAWHLEAVGSGGVRGTRDEATMDRAATLYDRVIQGFTPADFARFEFPRIVKEDWPTLGAVMYARADLLYERGRWGDCAKAFDAVFASDPSGKDAPEAAYGALLCYQKLRDQTHAKTSDREGSGLGPADGGGEVGWAKLAPRPIAELERNMIGAFDRYLCWLEPAAGDRAAEEQEVEVEFARARTYYEARHWEEAALGFRHIALAHPKHDAGIYAAQLYLECMNVLGTHREPRRGGCVDEMARDVPAIAKLYCNSSRSDVPTEQCDILARVQVGVERKQIEQLIVRADALVPGSRDAIALYKRGADRYRALWQDQCEGPLSKGERPKRCERAEEILSNMARAYQAAHLLGKAMLAREMLMDPKYGLDETSLGKRAIWELAGNYQAIAVYDRAAELYERYVEKTCKAGKCGEGADTALFDSAVLRLGLGQPDRAIESATRFERWFGKNQADKVAELRLSVAKHYAERGEWSEVVKKLRGALPGIDKNASLDVRIQVHAVMGRAGARTRQKTLARSEYRAVLALFSDPSRASESITSSEKDSVLADRRVGRALESVGEAIYFFADEKKARVDAVRFPVYKGPATKQRVLEHIHTKVAEWIRQKRPLIEDATAEFEKIVKLRPAVPPSWAISAGAAVGEMWGTFVKEFRAAPIPDSIRNDPELRAAYYEAIDRASEPQKKLAKRAYETCLGYSVTYQYGSAESRSCEEWLAETYKAEYHLIDEFRGTPTRKNDALGEAARPVRLVSGNASPP